MRALVLGLLLMAAPVSAQEGRVIPEHGRFTIIEEADMKPDPSLRYRVIFEVSSMAPRRGYERVARMMNLLGTGGVTMQPGDIAVVVHGAPIDALLTDAAHAKRYEGKPNPNKALINALMAAGADVRLCGQTARGRGVSKDELLPGVKLDTSAITTMATLQLKGWVMIQD